jgi:tRNA1(Val) A37 N6-methylase TrmN6
MTAAVAVQTVQKEGLSPKRYLDIGTGLASVLLMVHWKLGSSLTATVGIEAQSKHLELASRSLAFNGCQEEIQLVHGDLRNLDNGLTGNLGTFDLITGTPPYFPSRVGVLPTVSARGMCSFELRGGIEVYFQAAAKTLAPGRDSRFVVCQTSLEIPRTERAAHASGMTILERVDVHGKRGKHGPLFSVFVCGWSQEQPVIDCPAVRHVFARLEDNSYSEEMIQVMELLGKPIPRDHPRQPVGSFSKENDTVCDHS